MYSSSAKFYDVLYNFKDYRNAADQLITLVRQMQPNSRTLLDVACATGRHIEYLRESFDAEGLDINADLLERAKRRNPTTTFHCADMTQFDLEKRYDVVTCLFSSIAYARTVGNLRNTVACMARHLNEGGVILIEPWVRPDQYWEENIVLNTSVGEDIKVSWMYVGKRDGNVVTNDIHYLIGSPEGVTHLTEIHSMGLFSHQDYISSIESADLRLLSFDEKGFFGNGLYVAQRQ